MGCKDEVASPGSGPDYLSTQGEGVDNHHFPAVMSDKARWTFSPRPATWDASSTGHPCAWVLRIWLHNRLLSLWVGKLVVRGMLAGRGSLSHSPSGPSPAEPMRRTLESTPTPGQKTSPPLLLASLACGPFCPKPAPLLPAQQFHFPVWVGGAQRAEHPCAHAAPASAQVQLGRGPRSPGRLMERLPARGLAGLPLHSYRSMRL